MKLNFVILILLFSTEVLANCKFSLSAPAINYTVSDINPTTVYSLTLSRGPSFDRSCGNFLIGFSKGVANSYTRLARNSTTGTTLSYNFYNSSNASNILKDIPDANSTAELLTGSISRHSSKDINYYFTLGTLGSTSLTRGGLYRDTITVSTYSGTMNENNGFETSQTLSVNITVPKVASLSLVNTGSAYDSASTNKTLDFGELAQGQEMSFDVIVLSNAGYKLSVSSANNEVLQLVGGSPGVNTQIGYDFYANGSQRNLTASTASPVSISNAAGVTPMQGVRIPVRVVIQSVTDKAPGTYQDYVTFTIATTE